jgi:glycosyltransferase involved in cell wall biosynthesis
MIKILYITSTLKRTGPTNVMFNLIAELDKNTFQPIILTLSNDDPDFPSLRNEFEQMDVKIISLSMSRLQGFLSGTKRIKDIVEKNEINVIHIYGFRGDLLISPKKFPTTRVISTINSNIYDDYTMLYGKNKGRLMSWLHVKSLKGKTAIGCSKFVAGQLNDRYGCKLEVIYNGVSKSKYTVTSLEDKLSSRKILGLPIDHSIFIFVGYLIYRKDPITTIKAFLSSNLEKSTLIIIGDGPLIDKCKYLTFNDKNVIFYGNQPQTISFLRASDYYISSAYSEGLPTSVMEALACGLPVLLSDIKPHTELVEGSLCERYIFTINDYQDLSVKIKEILKTPYKEICLNARDVIDTKINSNMMAKMYQNLYK